MTTLDLTHEQASISSGENGWPVQGTWTYADYLRLPDDGNRYEIIEEVLYVTNAPSPEHQYAVTKLIFYFMQYTNDHPVGIVDPRTKSVEVFTWSNGEYALFGQFVGEEPVQSKLLDQLSIPVNLLFLP